LGEQAELNGAAGLLSMAGLAPITILPAGQLPDYRPAGISPEGRRRAGKE
jgi:hypothetical protein